MASSKWMAGVLPLHLLARPARTSGLFLSLTSDQSTAKMLGRLDTQCEELPQIVKEVRNGSYSSHELRAGQRACVEASDIRTLPFAR